MKKVIASTTLAALVAACACSLLTGTFSAYGQDSDSPTKPSIKLTDIPKITPGPDQTAEIKGKVAGVTPLKNYRVVIYSKSDHWYVQPTKDNPYTEIGDDGEFSTDIHGGTEYAALLVKPSYKPEGQIDHLPKAGGEVFAVVRKGLKSADEDKGDKGN